MALILFALLVRASAAALAEPLDGEALPPGPALAGSWYDYQRGLWFVIEPAGGSYRIAPVLLERDPDRRIANRLEGLTLSGRLVRGTLGFRGEGQPTGDLLGRTWLFEGSLKQMPGLARLEGEVRVERKPYTTPPLPSQRLVLHHIPGAPTLSIFSSGRPRPRPVAPESSALDLPIRVEVERLKVPGGVGQPHGTLERPRRHLTVRGSETWSVNPEGVW